MSVETENKDVARPGAVTPVPEQLPLDEYRKIFDKGFAAGVASVRQPVLSKEQVWLNAWCAVASCFNSDRAVTSKWADECLEEYRKRFL